MPMKYDLTETRMVKEKEHDEKMKEMYEVLMSPRPNTAECEECGKNFLEEEDECPECGSENMVIDMRPDPMYILMTGVYTEMGGSYGQRDKERLEGKYPLEPDEETLEKVLEENFNDVPEIVEENIDALVGMKVGASR